MRHSVRARPLLTLVCAGCALALPATPALAGGSPVHVDPSSPVAKEYALPLATARGAPPESGKSGSLFGSGIKHSTAGPGTNTTVTATPPQTVTESQPPATVTTSTRTSATKTPAHRQPTHVTTVTLPVLTATMTATTPRTASAAPAAYKVLRPGSGSGLLWMIVAAVVVIALGSAGGFALSRRR
jgi:hypothetical protein